MFSKTSTLVRFRQLDRLQEIADTFPDEVAQRAESEFYFGLRSDFLRDAQYEPDKPAPDPVGKSNTLNWTSHAQQKAFHGTKGFGRGIPTERSPFGSRVVDGITISLRTNRKSISFSVRSDDDRSQYVLGPLTEGAENEEGEEGAQEGFLNDRGWEPIAPKITYWRERSLKDFRDTLRQLIEELTNRSGD